MTQIPRVQSPSSSPVTDSTRSRTFTPQHVAQLARTLAAHGGGEASADLALDLVLHELVEYARDETGATGAAVALLRNNEMVCRATVGANAPDLGVRVETSSGLAGACLITGTVQHCSDCEEDPRVNAELCRRLDVRSMLIAPLILEGRVCGVLQVFSPSPHAFGEPEVEMVRAIASQIAESRRELDSEVAIPAAVQTGSPQEPSPWPANLERETLRMDDNTAPDTKVPRDALSSILFFLVIVAAVALGLLIGWRAASYGHTTQGETAPLTNGTATARGNDIPDRSDLPAPPNSGRAAGANRSTPNSAIPEGGLMVTQNGRVIYRSPADASSSATPNSAIDHHLPRLVHRVEPKYPEDARTQHIQGAVVLELQVLGNGEVGKVTAISGNPLLTQAAIEAVKQWRYQPYAREGKAVESQARVSINFVLPPS